LTSFRLRYFATLALFARAGSQELAGFWIILHEEAMKGKREVPHDRRFRFGVEIRNAGSAKEFRETVRRAEGLGYASLFVPDHFVDHPLAPLPALAVAAEASQSLRLATGVLGNDFRHPVALAREAATLDLLSDGRLELGLGAGWMTADYERSGIPLERPGRRIERLAEAIAVLKGLFADGPFSFRGKHYRVEGLDGPPKPAQRPHPPFLIGGGGRKVLALAAREAAIVGINALLRSGEAGADAARSLSPACTDEKLAWVREAAGERFAELELNTLIGVVQVTDDPRPFAQGMARAFGVPAEQALETPVALVGSVDSMVEALEARRERWQISYPVVPQAALETFAPVVARLAGR
jgi:probable F420-dependent oxidoreductase